MKYFGTDGIRGDAKNIFTYEFLKDFSISLSKVLKNNNIKKVCIGQDPRISSNYISTTIISLLLYEGINIENLGVVSTPTISYTLINNKDIELGIMISASHNIYTDNGIKLFGADGKKIKEQIELEIEANLESNEEKLLKCENFGILKSTDEYLNEYIKYIKSLGINFTGKTIALDTANGSASNIAPKIFEELGAKVKVIANKPDGYNINQDVGSTHTETLSKYIKNSKEKIDFGFAYDGDADRVMLFTKKGQVLDGDYILYLLAKAMQRDDKLFQNKIVITVMSNLGIKKALDDINVKYEECQVGDKYVMRKLEDDKLSLGGEQSGHIIIPNILPTGDGILVSVILSKIIMENGIDLTYLLGNVLKYPQKLVNIKVTDKKKIMENKELLNEINTLNKKFAMTGRILVRASGTENLIRIMAENEKINTCNEICDIIIEKIKYWDAKGEENGII